MRHSKVRMQGSQCSFSFCAFTVRTSTSTVQSSLLPHGLCESPDPDTIHSKICDRTGAISKVMFSGFREQNVGHLVTLCSSSQLKKLLSKTNFKGINVITFKGREFGKSGGAERLLTF